MFEPDCENYWCTVDNAINLEGPGKYGFVIAGGESYDLGIENIGDNEVEL